MNVNTILSFDFIKKIDRRAYICIFSSIVFGLIAHAAIFFNYIYMHDGIAFIFGVGSTAPSGRWSLWILKKAISIIFDGKLFSLPFIEGLITIIFVGIAVYLVVDLLDIKSKLLCVLLSGIIAVFPYFASLFNFMYTAPYYTFGFLIAIFGTYIFLKYKNIYSLLFGTAMVCLSIGIYQAILAVSTSLIIIYLIKFACDNRSDKEVLEIVIKSIVFVAMSLVLYIIAVKVICIVTGVKLWSYRGISNMGVDSITNYITKIKNAYIMFFAPKLFDKKLYSIFLYGKVNVIYYFSLFMLLYFMIIDLYKSFKSSIFKFIIVLLLYLVFPLSINLVILMCPLESSFYTFMYFSIVFYIVLHIWHIDNLKLYIKNVCAVIIIFVMISYIRYDNTAYLKLHFDLNRTINYFNIFISQVKNTDGYKDEYPVCYVNGLNFHDESIKDIDEFSGIYVDGDWGTNSLINNYAKWEFLRIWCGWYPTVVDQKDFRELPEVIEMPKYPDEGSIKVINNVVVIKF